MKSSSIWPIAAVIGLAIVYLVGAGWPHSEREGEFRISEFAKLPVQDGGRIKPIESLARVRLIQISHGQRVVHGDLVKDPETKVETGEVANAKRIPPSRWLLDTMLAGLRNELKLKNPAYEYRVFRIDNDQLVNSLGLPLRPGSWLYSYDEFADNEKFLDYVDRIKASEGPRKDDLFENKVAELFGQKMAFDNLTHMNVRLLHPQGRKQGDDVDWLPLGLVLQRDFEHEAGEFYMAMIGAYLKNNPDEFNKQLESYQKYLARNRSSDYHTARLEAFFDRLDPFTHLLVLYGFMFVLAAGSWLGWSKPLSRSAFWLGVFLFVVHSWAILTRMVLMGRPAPVTNLYSSALYIGWGCVALGLALEWIFKNGIPLVTAAVTGFLGVLIARNLISGDTMEMLQAVLDTNFWLATHVVCISSGYVTMFFAGFLGLLYLVLGMFTPMLRGQNGTDMTKMIYGVTCFSVLLSFVGTVLGGIWADESWGRFWGWDPKENGALLIVIWSALVLHARWGGMVRGRGLALLAIFGNVVTAWSWFGTNQLGIGLHAYGGSGPLSLASLVLIGFVVSQILIILIGSLVPLSLWKSFATPKSVTLVSAGAGT